MYPIFIAQGILADIGLVWSAGAHPRRVTRIRKTRQWCLSPDPHCHMRDAPSTVLEQASARGSKTKKRRSSSTSAHCTRPLSSLLRNAGRVKGKQFGSCSCSTR
ncbi:hypothetical protein EDB86DRAFT_2917611 [Lactarius hatsudake]|nr:hypothetical protein EDB86DRAFT_2917611 [Lactarius hatsudake]